ncbi:MAG: hypothetical protein HYZ29_13335 [Myxococcales bacterium]|nr:hypothetical protein [Myxococcales bacterium]
MSNRFFATVALALSAAACGSSDGASSGAATDLRVTLGGQYDAYAHQDTLSGQTAQAVSAGVRKLELFDDAGGVWSLSDASPGNLSVSYSATEPTTLATLAPAQVRAGHYVKARLVQDWSRFEIDASLHEGPTTTPGRLRVLMATSEAAEVDGQSLEQGQYRHVFVGAGADRSWDGVAPVAEHSTTAEAEAFDESGQWAVYFPVDLQVPGAVTGTLSFGVNLHHAFRWSDLGNPGYAAGVYDLAPPLYEPVEQFGGNRFDAELVTR